MSGNIYSWEHEERAGGKDRFRESEDTHDSELPGIPQHRLHFGVFIMYEANHERPHHMLGVPYVNLYSGTSTEPITWANR
jgi:hypothetical protein